MIRHFEPPDARRLKPNEFSGTYDLAAIFQDESYYKHTLVDDNSDVQAIIVFRPYWQNNYVAFFLISQDFPKRLASELKEFVNNAILDLGADRVQTDSVHCEVLNRWHDWLGFTLEGCREKMIEGKDFNMWAKLRGRDF